MIALIPRLRRYARALTGSRAHADDLVQDTLERALGPLPPLVAGQQPPCLAFYNYAQRPCEPREGAPEGAEGALEEDELQLSTRPTQEDRIEIRQLQIALKQLPSDQRKVLLLVGLEEMSYRETSTVLNIPVGTVMSRLARGRERLRTLMRDDRPIP